MIRQFVIDRRIITLPSPVRARVAETPQYHARDQLRFDGHARPV